MLSICNRLIFCALTCAIASTIFPSSASAQPTQWPTITGQILLPKGQKPPVMAPLVAVGAPACNNNNPAVDETLVVNPKNMGIKNVVVTLVPDGFKRGMPFPIADIHPNLRKSAKPNVDIDQPCCTFIPHIVVMRDDQSLTIKNSAAVPHNAKLAGFHIDINPLIPAGGSHVVPKMQADVIPTNLNCSIHGWMKAFVFSFDHPYFAVTDEDGKFEIKDAPVGKFKLVLYHEKSGWDVNGRTGQAIPLAALKTALPAMEFVPK